MRPILTVTLNPALDLSTAAASVRAGPKLRCEAPRADPGGGGINVSRVIARLGGESRAFVALGGATGERLAALLPGRGITLLRYLAPGETRESLSVTDRATGAQYRFVLPGPRWSKAGARALMAALADAVPDGAWVVLSGSQPPGLPDDLPLRLASRLRRRGAEVILDTSGPSLTHAARAAAGLGVLRMDETEAAELAGRPLETTAQSADFAEVLVRAGAARIVIVARGAEGSVLATQDQRLFARAADVPVISRIGAGDSFTAAFTLAMARGKPLPRALSEGMAAASAAVMTEATELCRASDVRRLIAACPVTPV